MAEKITTLHPDKAKQGVNIDKHKYDLVRNAILAEIDAHGEISFAELLSAVERRLPGFEGSINWYTTTIKLDLEARHLIERVSGKILQYLQRPR